MPEVSVEDVATKLNTAFGIYDKILYTPCAPSHGKAKRWVFNRNVWVLIVPKGMNSPTCIRDRRIIDKILIAKEVDSRYKGMRSKYGQAIARAEAMINS
jgi:hypothetical protein